MKYEIFTTKSAAETIDFGKRVAESLTGGELILLFGDLGAGKTQFTKGIATGLGITETVISPTFTIERTYEGKKLVLHHFDLYRTTEDRELEHEIRDLLSEKFNVVVVEWPDNMKSLMGIPHIAITIEETDEDERNIKIEEQNSWS